MSKERLTLTANENAYCWTVGTATSILMLIVMAIAATKNSAWAIPAYCLTLILLALFPVGIIMEIACGRWPVPTMVILCTMLSGVVGILLTIPLILPVD